MYTIPIYTYVKSYIICRIFFRGYRGGSPTAVQA